VTAAAHARTYARDMQVGVSQAAIPRFFRSRLARFSAVRSTSSAMSSVVLVDQMLTHQASPVHRLESQSRGYAYA